MGADYFFQEDPFSGAAWCLGTQTGSRNKIVSLWKMPTNLRGVSSPSNQIVTFTFVLFCISKNSYFWLFIYIIPTITVTVVIHIIPVVIIAVR